MNKITTVNGVLVAAQSDFASHAQDKMIHLTEEERICLLYTSPSPRDS